MPVRSFSPSGGGKIGGGAAVSETDEHATNPKHIQTIIRLRIVDPIPIPHWNAGRLTELGQLDPLPRDIATVDSALPYAALGPRGFLSRTAKDRRS